MTGQLLDEFKPDDGLSKFLETDLHLVDEVPAGDLEAFRKALK